MTKRPFLERLFVVLWALCLAIAAASAAAALVSSYKGSHTVAGGPDEYASWIVQNADRRGTPEFEMVASAYRAAKTAQSSADLSKMSTEDLLASKNGVKISGRFEFAAIGFALYGALVLFLLIVGAAAQYLALGYGSPIRLFRPHPTAR